MAVTIESTPTPFALTRNPAWFTLRSVGYENQEGYYVAVRLVVGLESSAWLRAYPGDDGLIGLEMASVLAAMAEKGLSGLSSLPEGPYAAGGRGVYTLEYQEYYGAPPALQSSGATSSAVFVVGGVDAAVFRGGAWWADQQLDSSFATWWPRRRTISRDCPAFVAWQNRSDGPVNISLDVDPYNLGGNRYPDPGGRGTATVPPGQVYVFPCSFVDLGLRAETSFYHVRVRLPDVGGEAFYSSRYTFVVEPEAYGERCLIALNAWRAPEVIRCTGVRQSSVSYGGEEVRRALPRTYAPADSIFDRVGATSKPSYTYRTGALTRAEAECVAALLAEGEIYEATAGGLRQLVPTGLRRVDLGDESERVVTLDIQVKRALPRGTYTPPERATDGRGLSYWQDAAGRNWEEADEDEFWQNS